MNPEKKLLIETNDFHDSVVKEVTSYQDNPGHYAVTMESGLGFAHNFGSMQPQVGDRIRMYPAFGSIQGVDLNGAEVDFRTKAQVEAEHQEMVARAKQEREVKFLTGDRERLDAEFATLPNSFQTRIQIFRDHCADFRWEFESYEMFACTEAVKIARHLRSKLEPDATAEDIRQVAMTFQKANYDEQREVISDGHSGNTFGVALLLARLHLMDEFGLKAEPSADGQELPDMPLVVQAHGALTPLVGCDDYGCVHPRPESES